VLRRGGDDAAALRVEQAAANAAAIASGEYRSAEAVRFLEFFCTGKRGFIRPRSGELDKDAAD